MEGDGEHVINLASNMLTWWYCIMYMCIFIYIYIYMYVLVQAAITRIS